MPQQKWNKAQILGMEKTHIVMKASDIKKILWLISFISHRNKNVDETDKLLKISFCQNLLKNK